jgi:predicted HTH transcriptional regulator
MRKGGESDPRNKTLMKMFNPVNIGERSGSGVPNIFNTWEDQGWKEPVIEERFDPDRTILTLEFVDKTNKEKTAKKTSEGSKIRNKTIENMVKIENYLKENGESKTNAIAEYLNLSSARTRKILSEMKTIEAIGTNTNRKYRLKDNQK